MNNGNTLLCLDEANFSDETKAAPAKAGELFTKWRDSKRSSSARLKLWSYNMLKKKYSYSQPVAWDTSKHVRGTLKLTLDISSLSALEVHKVGTAEKPATAEDIKEVTDKLVAAEKNKKPITVDVVVSAACKIMVFAHTLPTALAVSGLKTARSNRVLVAYTPEIGKPTMFAVPVISIVEQPSEEKDSVYTMVTDGTMIYCDGVWVH